MKKRTYVGALTRPISLTAAIRVENPYNAQNTSQYGTLSQAFDTLTGEYYPNRGTYPTLLGLHVLMEDPNSAAAASEVQWTGGNTVSWEVIRNGVATPVTSQVTGEFTLYGAQLRVRLNQTAADGNVRVRATGTFHDSVGRTQTAVAEEELILSMSTATNLTLLRDKLGTAGYAGDFYRLNPLTLDTAAKLSNTANWKKKCAVKLCDGTIPLPDAFPLDSGGDAMDETDYADTPQGSAFYFWFYRTPDNRLVQCTEDTEWLDAAWLPSGTASKEVTVDLTKVKHVLLVCRAGYIPYGQTEDYLDADGLVRPEKLYLGFREATFDVGVELPDVERITDVDIAHCRLERTELASSAVTIVKRAMVMAGGSTLNDLAETAPHGSGTQSWVERLYNIEWFVTRGDGTDVSIGTGEWLQITPAQLATLYGAALNADAMPPMTVSVEPVYPKLTGNNYVEGYRRGASAITPSQQQGNKGFLRQLDFWLMDTTDNTGETTQGMKLQRNNILRFAGGGWAPAVRISEAQMADSQRELWFNDDRQNDAGWVRFCEAGQYSPEAYLAVLRDFFSKGNSYGHNSGDWQLGANGWPGLYKRGDAHRDGTEFDYHDEAGTMVEAHAVLPWETTETKYTIGVGYAFGVYLLDHQQREGGEWEWNGIFTDRTEWDGIDFSRFYLPPTAFSPGPSTQITENGKTVLRNFFYLAHPQGGIGGAPAAGILGSTMFNEAGRAYPKTDDMHAVTNAARARANNSVAGRSYPFAEGGYLTLDTLVTSQELLYSRRNPFTASMFGSGISSNDGCSSEAAWRQNGGVRHKVSGASSYGYCGWSAALPVKSSPSSTKSASEDLNEFRGKEQCMESQLAASFAAEFGIAATTNLASPVYFTVYGGKYYWMKPENIDSLAEGYMNVRVYREMHDTLTGYDSGGTQTTCDFTAILRMSLMGGMSLSGDIYAYTQGGAEVIGECTVAPATSKTGNPVASYLIPDQRKWLNDGDITKDSPAKFLIETSADAIKTGEGTNLADGYYGQRIGYSPIKATNAGSLSSYECCYGYTRNEWATAVDKRARIGLRFHGLASYSSCSPRHWAAFSSASHAYRNYGGSTQALIGT